MKRFLLLLVFIGIAHGSFGQKVARYYYGKAGTANYEEFSFWQGVHNLLRIDYAYGKERKEMKVSFAGKGMLGRDACFKVKYDNGRILYIVPHDKRLMITDNTPDYKKDFLWVHHGEDDACEDCVDDDNEAIELIWNYFMR
jgi:hypothetical protein